MISHLTQRERLGYAAIIGLLLFGAGYVGAHRLRKPAPVVFESAPASKPIGARPVDAADPSVSAPNKARKTLAALHSISINSASKESLETLPGIGPALAQRIIDYRTAYGPFRSTEQLRQVKGIGEKKFSAIKSYLKD